MSDISNAIKQICDEKGLSYDAVILEIDTLVTDIIQVNVQKSSSVLDQIGVIGN